MIFVAVYTVNPLPSNSLDIVYQVEHAFPWAPRTEIHSALQRMVKAGRIRARYIEGRTLPLYELPDAIPTPTSPAA